MIGGPGTAIRWTYKSGKVQLHWPSRPFRPSSPTSLKMSFLDLHHILIDLPD